MNTHRYPRSLLGRSLCNHADTQYTERQTTNNWTHHMRHRLICLELALCLLSSAHTMFGHYWLPVRVPDHSLCTQMLIRLQAIRCERDRLGSWHNHCWQHFVLHSSLQCCYRILQQGRQMERYTQLHHWRQCWEPNKPDIFRMASMSQQDNCRK